MWRLIRASFSVVVIAVGILAGVTFIDANRTQVNVQFPIVARESGDVSLGMALIAAGIVGMGVALLIAFAAAVGMSLHTARLKREIKALQKEVDSLRNLPLLEEEIGRETDDEDGEDILHASRTIETGSRWTARQPDVVPDGPVRAGSTAADVIDDEDDDEEERESPDALDASKTVPGLPASGNTTRKSDVP